ncbi:MAG: hypothetical protein WA040_05535 [Anaerolineae bacterium]
MTSTSVTLQLPEPVFSYLSQVAIAPKRPLEQVVRQSVEVNLPPSVATVPAEMRDELLAMQAMSVEQLSRIAAQQIAPSDQAHHLELLEKNSVGDLTRVEQEELEELRLAADRLTVRKAYAWSVLRWRGVATPRLDELPLE